MSFEDSDLEAAEGYLDGEPLHTPAMDSRVANPKFAAAVDAARAEREMRKLIFASMEPTDSTVDQFVYRVKRDAARHRMMSGASRWLKVGAAVAACVAVSFAAGWQFRGRPDATKSTGVVQNVVTPAAAAPHTTYQVALTDEHGQVTAVQDFDSLEKAREFSHDLTRWQERQGQLRDGGAVVVADRF